MKKLCVLIVILIGLWYWVYLSGQNLTIEEKAAKYNVTLLTREEAEKAGFDYLDKRTAVCTGADIIDMSDVNPNASKFMPVWMVKFSTRRNSYEVDIDAISGKLIMILEDN